MATKSNAGKAKSAASAPKVDVGHHYVVIGYSAKENINTEEFEKAVSGVIRSHLGNEGQGDPGKGGLAGGRGKKFEDGWQKEKGTKDSRHYGAIGFSTVGTARKWLRCEAGKQFKLAYDVVFIQATIGCPKTDEDGV